MSEMSIDERAVMMREEGEYADLTPGPEPDRPAMMALIGESMVRQVMEATGLNAEESAMLLLEKGAAPDAYEAISARAAAELTRLCNEGQIPGAPEDYLNDEEFLPLLKRMPANAALELICARRDARDAKSAIEGDRERGARDVLEKLASMRRLPTSIRTQAPAITEPDFTGMSADDFFALKKRLAAARK